MRRPTVRRVGRLERLLRFLRASGAAALLACSLVAGAEEASPPDSARMSRDLQQMPWPSFRRVVEAIPKLRASIDMYGPLGWQLVHDNYSTFNWAKRIDKLDAEQKQQLGELIEAAKSGS